MQRIKTVRWPRRNIGGDRAYTKLFYCTGQNFGIAVGQTNNAQNIAMNVGANSAGANAYTINGVFGSTPNLSVLAAQYLQYRIKGISLKLTYWQQSGDPVCLFTNAQSNASPYTVSSTGPSPGFITPGIFNTPEQRWAKYRTCAMTSAGAKPTQLKVYYSVNKVQGPDVVVKNDEEYTGSMQAATPYFSNGTVAEDQPGKTPWAQFGLMTLSGANAVAAVAGVLKVEATVYTEFFGKRPQTQ